MLQVQYDLLVGADGAGSVVRSALEQIMPPGYIRRYRHKQVYTMATATPSCPAEIPQHSVLQMHNVKVATLLLEHSVLQTHNVKVATLLQTSGSVWMI